MKFFPDVVVFNDAKRVFSPAELREKFGLQILEFPLVVIGIQLHSDAEGEGKVIRNPGRRDIGRRFENDNTYSFPVKPTSEEQSNLFTTIGRFRRNRAIREEPYLNDALVVVRSTSALDMIAACLVTGALPVSSIEAFSLDEVQQKIDFIIGATRRKPSSRDALIGINWYLENFKRTNKNSQPVKNRRSIS